MTPKKPKATPGGVARGRPRNSADENLRRQDAIIAAAVTTMCMWGLSLRGRVCPAVSSAARSCWSRELKADAVEKIWERASDAYGLGRRVSIRRFDLDWRKSRRPQDANCMKTAAKVLLRNGGRWPIAADDDFSHFQRSDAVLTPKAHAEYQRSRLRIVIKHKLG